MSFELINFPQRVRGADPVTKLGTITYLRYMGTRSVPMANYNAIQEVHAVSPSNPSRIDIYNPRRGPLNTLRNFEPRQTYIVYTKRFSSDFTVSDGLPTNVPAVMPSADPAWRQDIRGCGIGWPNIFVWAGPSISSLAYSSFIRVAFYPNPSRTMLRAWIPGTSSNAMAPTFEFQGGYTIYAKSNFTIAAQLPPATPPPTETRCPPPPTTPTPFPQPPPTPTPGCPNKLLAFNNDDIVNFVDDNVEAFGAPVTDGTFVGGDVQPCRTVCSPDVIVVTGSRVGQCWGGQNGIYTEDSALGVAAVHAGLIQVGQIARIRLIPRGWYATYAPVTANGITTLPWTTGWCGFQLVLDSIVQIPTTPAVIPDGSNFRLYQENSRTPNPLYSDPVVVRLTGTTSGLVLGGRWGIYGDGSNWSACATHAGLLEPGETKLFQLVRANDWAHRGTTVRGALGMVSTALRNLAGGVTIAAIVPQNPPIICTPPNSSTPICVLPPAAINGNNIRMYTGGSTPNCGPNSDYTSPQIVRLTGNTTGRVWGGQSGIYTDDSDFGAAAVHAGLLASGAVGIFQLVRVGWQNSYRGTSANGVTTLPYSGWCGVSIRPLGSTTVTLPGAGNATIVSSVLNHGDVITFLDIVDNPVVSVSTNYVVGLNPGNLPLPGLTRIAQLPAKRAEGCPREQIPPRPPVPAHPGAAPGRPANPCGGKKKGAKKSCEDNYNKRTIPAWQAQVNAFNQRLAAYNAAMAPVTHWDNTYTKSPWTDRCWLQAEDCNFGLTPDVVLVTGNTQGTVWGGDGVYTADSNIGTAAVHAGLIQSGETALIRVRIAGYRTGFAAGGVRNNVNGNPWPHRYCAISLELVQKLTVLAPHQFCILANNTVLTSWGDWIVRPGVTRVRRVSDGSIFYVTGTGTFGGLPTLVYRA